jgi:general secretion pathway protein G
LVAASRGGRQAGFTLIELMIVMAIIVVLAGVGLAVYNNSIVRAKEAALKTDLFQMRDSIDQYYADKNKYPGSLQDLVTDKYMRTIPVDPFTGSAETWQTIMSEPDPRNPTADIGIYDVRSGSTAMSLDGTPYAEWQ